MAAALELGPTLDYVIVDVFTDTAFRGNQLAVVLGADGLATEQLQALAAEFHLSETAFPMAPARTGADYRLRIFTTDVELPFAGHPSVGSAWVLHALGLLAAGERVQECGAGLLPVVVGAEEATITGGAPLLGDQVDPGPLLAAVGLAAADLQGPPAGVAGCGISFGFLGVRRDAVDRAVPDRQALLRLGFEAGLCVLGWDAATSSAYSRVFAAGVGVTEDAATGSAALGLGVWLGGAGALPDGRVGYDVHQGHAMGRPSLLHCAVDVLDGRVVRAQVGGRVVAVARGSIACPR